MILKSEIYHFPPPRPHPRRGSFKKLQKFFYARPLDLVLGVPPSSTRPSRALSANGRSHAYGIGDAKRARVQLGGGRCWVITDSDHHPPLLVARWPGGQHPILGEVSELPPCGRPHQPFLS